MPIASAVYVAGLGGDNLLKITGNAVKGLVGDRLTNAEKIAGEKLGNTISDDKITKTRRSHLSTG